jgi:hypothetical protein
MVDGPGSGIIINDGIFADYLKKISILVSQNKVHTYLFPNHINLVFVLRREADRSIKMFVR